MTTYDYNGAGDVASVDYSDSTPDVTFGYNRRGQQTTVMATDTNSVSTVTAMAYNIPGQLLAESYTGGPLDGLSVTNGYDDLLRRTSVSVLDPSSQTLSASGYSYDAASRLATVSEGTNSATYGYLANSPLVESIVFKQGAATRMTTTKSYDNLNRLLAISSIPSAQTPNPISFSYAYNDANQRTAVTNADASRWNFGYDTLGQVTSGKKSWSDGTKVAGEQFEYTFDDIGNRKQSRYGGDANGSTLRRFNYSVNLLNQYTTRSAGPGTTRYANVLGEATNAATVTVNDQAPYRKGDFFRLELAVTNTSPVWLGVTNIAVLNQGTNADLIATNLGSVFVPPTPEAFGYDADGNMTNDGRFALTWDAENRLVKVESLASAPAGSKRKVEWTFDGLGRRVRQVESIWNPSTINYEPSTDIKLLNDGWRCIAELNATNLTLRTYAWGLDLSGSLGGAGGVGGLLMINSAAQSTHFYAMDGNGNTAALVSAATGTASANYEYEPFGVTLRATGPMALENPFRFSTKRTSDATDWVLYEYRIYNPSTGRWLGRDPIEERGGVNLYGMVVNNAISRVDPIGLEPSWEQVNSLKQAVKNAEIALAANQEAEKLLLKNYWGAVSGPNNSCKPRSDLMSNWGRQVEAARALIVESARKLQEARNALAAAVGAGTVIGGIVTTTTGVFTAPTLTGTGGAVTGFGATGAAVSSVSIVAAGAAGYGAGHLYMQLPWGGGGNTLNTAWQNIWVEYFWDPWYGNGKSK